MKRMISLSSVLLVLVHLCAVQANATPEQVHLSFGSNASEIIVTWHTVNGYTAAPIVEYGLSPNNLSEQVHGESQCYPKIPLFTYRALLGNLEPLTEYYYRVGSKDTAEGNWSALFHFRTVTDDPKWLPSLAIYGDMGYQNAEILSYLEADIEANMYNGLFHIGDIGYDMHERKGKRGNEFMNLIEKIASRVPLSVCAGNHDKHGNFSHYDARFSMMSPNANLNSNTLESRFNNHYYSYNLGPLHVIVFNSEFYYYSNLWGTEQIGYQFEWLKADLARANANRAQQPWIIAMFHRPLYCLRIADDSCNKLKLERKSLRKGVSLNIEENDNEIDSKASLQYGLEELFYSMGVDMLFSGHEHFLARTLPIYDYKIRSGDVNANNPYEEPKGPVHFITGSAGNRELHSPVNPLVWFQKWIPAFSFDYGYTRLRLKDRLTILVEQVSADENGSIIDQIEISKKVDQPAWMR